MCIQSTRYQIVNSLSLHRAKLKRRFNPSSHSPFFPHHATASGHIEPGSLGHMRPGYEKAASSSLLPPHRSCRRALDTVSIDTISFNIVYVACQVVNKIQEYIYFFDMLKEASGCHIKGNLPTPCTQDTVTKSCGARSELEGAIHGRSAGPFFPTQGGRISMAQVSYDLDFSDFCTFCRISQKASLQGESPEAKNMQKMLLQEYDFFRIFLPKRFLSCKH